MGIYEFDLTEWNIKHFSISEKTHSSHTPHEYVGMFYFLYIFVLSFIYLFFIFSSHRSQKVYIFASFTIL